MVAPVDKDLGATRSRSASPASRRRSASTSTGSRSSRPTRFPDEPRRRFKVPKGILGGRVQRAGDAGRRTAPRRRSASRRSSPGTSTSCVLEGEWEVLPRRSDADDPALSAGRNEQPKTAAYTEAGFRQSSTPLDADDADDAGPAAQPAESLAKMKTAGRSGGGSDARRAARRAADAPQLRRARPDVGGAVPAVSVPRRAEDDQPGQVLPRRGTTRSRPPPPNHDRGRDVISVHEDTDGDGKFDKHKVVLDGPEHGQRRRPRARRHLGDAHAVPAVLPRRRRRRRAGPRPGSAPRRLRPGRHPLGRQRPRSGAPTAGSTARRAARRPAASPARASTRPTSPGVYFEGCMVWRYHPDDEGLRDLRRGRRQHLRPRVRRRGPALLRPQRRRRRAGGTSSRAGCT